MLLTFEAVKPLGIPATPVLALDTFQVLSTSSDAKDKRKQGRCGPVGWNGGGVVF